jgi:hypothetical protein
LPAFRLTMPNALLRERERERAREREKEDDERWRMRDGGSIDR